MFFGDLDSWSDWISNYIRTWSCEFPRQPDTSLRATVNFRIDVCLSANIPEKQTANNILKWLNIFNTSGLYFNSILAKKAKKSSALISENQFERKRPWSTFGFDKKIFPVKRSGVRTPKRLVEYHFFFSFFIQEPRSHWLESSELFFLEWEHILGKFFELIPVDGNRCLETENTDEIVTLTNDVACIGDFFFPRSSIFIRNSWFLFNKSTKNFKMNVFY